MLFEHKDYIFNGFGCAGINYYSDAEIHNNNYALIPNKLAWQFTLYKLISA